eukprot:Nk52_evm28s243 gene=Nk52_evmTU28s243
MSFTVTSSMWRLIIVCTIIALIVFSYILYFLAAIGGNPMHYSFLKPLELVEVDHQSKPILSFTCEAPTAGDISERSENTTAYDLYPSDFGVVGGMGDSVTAGLFARGNTLLFDWLEITNWREARELSFVSGTEDGQSSLFNFFKKFNPEVVGGSTKDHLVYKYSYVTPGPSSWLMPYDGLNTAISGSGAEHVAKLQAPYLIKKLEEVSEKQLGNTDMLLSSKRGEWKFINIFIGTNDMCGACEDGLRNSLRQYHHYVNETIRHLRSKLSGVYINIVPINIYPEYVYFGVLLQRPLCRQKRLANLARSQSCKCVHAARDISEERPTAEKDIDVPVDLEKAEKENNEKNSKFSSAESVIGTTEEEEELDGSEQSISEFIDKAEESSEEDVTGSEEEGEEEVKKKEEEEEERESESDGSPSGKENKATEDSPEEDVVEDPNEDGGNDKSAEPASSKESKSGILGEFEDLLLKFSNTEGEEFTWEKAMDSYNEVLEHLTKWWYFNCGHPSLQPGASISNDLPLHPMGDTSDVEENEDVNSNGYWNGIKDYRCDDFAIRFNPSYATDICNLAANGDRYVSADLASSTDCYHLSKMGQGSLATIVWNSMFTEDMNLPTPDGESLEPLCPEKDQNLLVWLEGYDK